MHCFLKKQRILAGILLALLALSFSCNSGGGGGFIPPPPSISAVAGNGSVTVSWVDVSGATSYFVYSSLSSPVSHATATKHTVSGTTFVDTGLTDGERRYYVITSVKDGIESLDSSEVSAVPGTFGAISGKITYEDKELGASGLNGGFFTGNKSVKAVRYAAVDVVSSSTSSILYTTWTNSLGIFSIPISTGSTTVYIRVNSEALPPGGTQPITVTNTNLDLLPATYGVPSTNFTLAGSANVNISIPTTNTFAGAFNILDVMTTGYDFIKSLSGSYPAVPLDVFWEQGKINGTFFCTSGCPPGNGIYVLSETNGDTDEYDDDVLWHEFGHFVASTFSLDQSPGGFHMLGDSEQDLRFSWSEGWGNFFPGAVKNWLFTSGQSSLISSAPGVSLTTYVDTSATGGFSFDFGSPDSRIRSNYSTNEVAVAKLLTDLNSALAMSKIWSVVSGFLTSSPPASQPVNLELFWDRWLSANPADLATLQATFNDRAINYQNDTNEQNNTYQNPTNVTVGIPLTNTLYNSTLGIDVDYAVFSATSRTYTIKTSNLLNGADTFITLYSSSGTTVVATNDNGNGTGIPYTSCQPFDLSCDNFFPLNSTTNLSSKISFFAESAGPYYVEVKASPNRPNSAGRYGSYTLTITSP